ncbi:MAG: dTDP-4-dehydrorhamnose 3,5-epimerase [Spirochaetes bacterium GWF1_49_6]|nr:MAG: dTDP-4-dehydrorhamnose 3,5-epimerase [Spirochaetes bacterium GWF1_49_6]
MKVQAGAIEGTLIITPDIFEDERGFFLESYNRDKFAQFGIDIQFPQDNHSKSVRNTLRGLHYQTHPGQAKLVRVIHGAIWDVAVDIRPGSPTLGKWFGLELSAKNKQMFFIPAGFAHGFCVTSETAEVLYKVSSVYNPQTEAGLMWNDPDIGIEWPSAEPVLSNRDMNNPSFKEYKKGLKK